MSYRSEAGSPPIVGLTGGIASGKSTVAALFAEHAIPNVDADDCAREVVEPGSAALQEIRRVFGDRVIAANGHLDRARLREQVFADSAARKRLEALLHPRIRQLMHRKILALSEQAPAPAYILAVIPLLIETGQESSFDRLLVVHVDPAVQLQRLLARDSGSLEQAQAILASQISAERRLALADDIIDNSDGRELLREQIDRLHGQYLQTLAAKPGA